MPKKVNREDFFIAVRTEFGNDKMTITRQEIIDLCDKTGLKYPTWFVNDATNRHGRGVYKMPSNTDATPVVEKNIAKPKVEKEAATIQMVSVSTDKVESDHIEVENFTPEKIDGYVPFGHFKDVRSIVKSRRFYPVYITGLSGNGKTMMVEQVCAAEKRECIRVNITVETDEDDLIGGFRLVNGETVWHDGPVTQAMQRGAVLLLDEVDLGSHKLMCLQPILEGKGLFLKKVGRVIHPEKGFNIIATANTKGKGSDDGRFIGTNVMNEAFLERFSITLEQEYPPAKVEHKILKNVLNSFSLEEDAFIDRLVAWAGVVREAFYGNAVNEVISTRRLVHICEAFAILKKDRMYAINLCLNRFDTETKQSFLELYKKVDETIDPIPAAPPVEDVDTAADTASSVAQAAAGQSNPAQALASSNIMSHDDIKAALTSDDWFEKIHQNLTSTK